MAEITMTLKDESSSALNISLEDFVQVYFTTGKRKNAPFFLNLASAQIDVLIYYSCKFKNIPQDIETKHSLLTGFIEKQRFLSYKYNKERLELYEETGNPEYLKCPKNSS
jgi:hypothetical protein